METPAANYKALEIPGTLHFNGKPHRLLTLTSSDPPRLAALVAMARDKGWQDYADGTDTATGKPAVWLLKPTS